MEESATLAVTAKAAQLIREGVDVISFGAGEPDFDTPDRVKQVGVQAILNGQTKYSKPASGLLETKQAICTKYARENDLQYEPANVIVTAGGKLACQMACLATLNPGDECIIPVPYWVSYPELVKMAGATSVFIDGDEANNFCITAEQVRRALTPRTRMIVFNSPSNPGGFTYSEAQVRELAAILADHDLYILADEIYDRLIFGDARFLSIASVSERAKDQTIIVNGGSKTYAMTGWRIGYALGPRPVIEAMAKLQSQGSSGAATFTQLALAHALTADQTPVENMRREYERRAAHIHRRLNELPGVSCVTPTGAFYAFPNVSAACRKLGVTGSLAFSAVALERARVAVVPGVAFGKDDNVRLSFACSLQNIDEGLDRLATMLA
jgi:aspartate aminotransferase